MTRTEDRKQVIQNLIHAPREEQNYTPEIKKISVNFPVEQEFYEPGLQIIQSSEGIFDFDDQVPGFLSGNEGIALLLSARNGPGSGEIVEIGSFLGKSTIWLASGSVSLGREKITAIDPHIGSPEHQPGAVFDYMMPDSGTTYQQFLENLRRYELLEHVVAVRQSSTDALQDWQRSIRLLFIDGDHSYEAVREDFTGWSEFLIPGGIVAFHDVGPAFAGPQKVVEEFIMNSNAYRPLAQIHSLFIAQKL